MSLRPSVSSPAGPASSTRTSSPRPGPLSPPANRSSKSQRPAASAAPPSTATSPNTTTNKPPPEQQRSGLAVLVLRLVTRSLPAPHSHRWLRNGGGHRALGDVEQTRQHLLRMTAP